MNTIAASQFNDRDPSNNIRQFNSLYIALASGASASNEDFGMKKYFGDLYVKARFSIENTFDQFLQGTLIAFSPTKKFEKYIATVPYTDSMSFRAEVPEGLKSTYLEYLADLIPAQTRANQLLANVIFPFEAFVGKMISDEVFRHQFDHQIKEFKPLEAGYEKTIASLGKHFVKNGYNASAKFADVVKRTGDWSTVFKQTAELSELYQAFPQMEITKRLNRLYESLDALTEIAGKDGFAGTDKKSVRLLSDGMYHIARELELAALTTYRSRNFIQAINATVESIGQVSNIASDKDGDHEYR